MLPGRSIRNFWMKKQNAGRIGQRGIIRLPTKPLLITTTKDSWMKILNKLDTMIDLDQLLTTPIDLVIIRYYLSEKAGGGFEKA